MTQSLSSLYYTTSNIGINSIVAQDMLHAGSMTVTVGVLALQGAFLEHLVLLRKAATQLQAQARSQSRPTDSFIFTEVRNVNQLAQCDALIIPGGESTTISFVAAQSGLLEPLRDFVKYASISIPCANLPPIHPLTDTPPSESAENQPGEHVPA